MEYFGVDVSKDSLQVSTARGPATFRIAGLLGWIASGQTSAHLILEPTSTYHHPLLAALGDTPTLCTLINPARTAAFARAQGIRAKTDPVDARVLASLGESQQPQPTPPPQADQEGLKASSGWRGSCKLDTAQFSPWTPQAVLDSLERTIDRLTREIESVREAINRQLEHHSGWRPGVGPRQPAAQ